MTVTVTVTKAEASTAKTARICWKSGVRTGHTRFFYPLRLLKQRGLMVQLPYLFMPFGPRLMGLRKEIMLFGFSFDNVERNDANRKALEFLQELDERCKNLVESKEVVISWVPLLLPTSRGFPPFCRVSCHNPNKTLAFNAEKETISLDNLSGKVYARVILSFDGVWLNTSTKQSGIDANVVQVQVQPASISRSVLDTYSFVDDILPVVVDDDRKPEDHPLFGKYFRMLSMGVPDQAVRQKLRLCGLPEDVLDSRSYTSLEAAAEASRGTGSGNGGDDLFSASITSGVVELRQRPISADTSPRNIEPLTFSVSQGDVVTALKSLRRTGSNLITGRLVSPASSPHPPSMGIRAGIGEMLSRMLLKSKT